MSTDPTDRAAIERDIRARQQHLASTVDELAERVAPKAIAQAAAAGAASKAKKLLASATGRAHDTAAAVQGRAHDTAAAVQGRAHDTAAAVQGRAHDTAAAVQSRVHTTPTPAEPLAITAGGSRRSVVVSGRSAVLDEDGAVRVARVTAAGSALLALLGAVIWRRSR